MGSNARPGGRTVYDFCDFSGTVFFVENLAQAFTPPLQGVAINETILRGAYGFNHADFVKAIEWVEQPDTLQAPIIRP